MTTKQRYKMVFSNGMVFFEDKEVTVYAINVNLVADVMLSMGEGD